MELMKVAILFAVTAVAEIVGCYLPWLVLKQGKPAWLLIPAALSLGLFAWLLPVCGCSMLSNRLVAGEAKVRRATWSTSL